MEEKFAMEIPDHIRFLPGYTRRHEPLSVESDPQLEKYKEEHDDDHDHLEGESELSNSSASY